MERYHKTIKSECIRPNVSLSQEKAKNQIAEFVRHYNENRLHSAIGYIASKNRDSQIFKEGDQKHETAREALKQKRMEMRQPFASKKISTTADTINQIT
ncbi:MAG: transposase [Chlorobiaceae bacterium]|nr:transposase [Chlorobiaceae bacterium]